MNTVGSLDYSDLLTKRPVRPEDAPAPEPQEGYEAFKDYVSEFCVRPVLVSISFTGTYCHQPGASSWWSDED